MSLINDALKRARKQNRARPRLNISTHEALEPVGDSTWTSEPSERKRSMPWPWIVAALLSLGLCLIVAGWFFGNAMTLLRKSTDVSDSSQNAMAQEAGESPGQPVGPDEIQTEPDPASSGTILVESDKTSSIPPVVKNEITFDQNSEDLKSNGSGEAPIHHPSGDPMTERESETSFPEPANNLPPQTTLPAPQPSVVTAKVYLTKIPAEGGWPELKLQGIFYDADAPVALINNRDLLAGESLGKVRVISIESKKVTLQLGQEQKILQFRR